MSSRTQKKQLSTLENVSILSDQELREALKGYNQNPGPITDSTRNLYRKKLASLMEEISDDTSDEDYNVQDEESSDDEDDSYDEDEFEDYNEPEAELEAETAISKSQPSPKLFSQKNLTLLAVPLISYLMYYLYAGNFYKSLIPLQQYKNITRQLLILLALSPVVYVVYRVVRFYRQRRYQDSQIVCAMVDKSLELLQSPDNPTGLMPILHIRDTLLTPAERKTTKATNLWAKTVKFIEEHESRIKVELVNIDGEDFRAWKWIGSRKF